MDTDTLGYRNEGEDRISGLGIATLGEVEIHVVDIHINFDCQALEFVLGHILMLLVVNNGHFVGRQESLAQTLDILFAGSHRLIHIRDLLVAQFERHACDVGFRIFEFPVFELTLDNLFSFACLLVFQFFERLSDLAFGF